MVMMVVVVVVVVLGFLVSRCLTAAGTRPATDCRQSPVVTNSHKYYQYFSQINKNNCVSDSTSKYSSQN